MSSADVVASLIRSRASNKSQTLSNSVGGGLKMREWKMQEQIAGVENAGVEKAGSITYRKPSEQKTLKIPGV